MPYSAVLGDNIVSMHVFCYMLAEKQGEWSLKGQGRREMIYKGKIVKGHLNLVVSDGCSFLSEDFQKYVTKNVNIIRDRGVSSNF